MRAHVRCRRGAWAIEPSIDYDGGFRVQSRHARENSPWLVLGWNGQRLMSECPSGRMRDILRILLRWKESPCWLAIAYLCCEARPIDGPAFAAAIIDANADDDTPALIACDWLEELGAEGEVPLHGKDPTPGWAACKALDKARGPLSLWGRHLIETRCIGCGSLHSARRERPGFPGDLCMHCGRFLPFSIPRIPIPKAA